MLPSVDDANGTNPMPSGSQVAANHLRAGEALRLIQAGELSCEELMRATLAEIERRDPVVRAFVCLDPERALAAARAADAVPKERRGPLHGLPAAIKDTYDTADFPTAYGIQSAPWRDHRPAKDALVITRMRQAGALIPGKVTTTEWAYRMPSATTNPRDPKRTPGGSSQGSAAAVGAHMALIGVGSQTNGSMIRPAAYCGVYGHKATWGLIPRTGLAPFSPTLDTPGGYANDLEGLARLMEVMIGPDPDDQDCRGRAGTAILPALKSGLARKWRVGFVRTPRWGDVEPAIRQICDDFAKRLGRVAAVEEVTLPADFAAIWDHLHVDIQFAGLARQAIAARVEAKPEEFSEAMREGVRRGRSISDATYAELRQRQRGLARAFDGVLAGVDVAIGPSALDEAPIGIANTGRPTMQTLWTFTGTPSLNVPYFTGPNGLPVGLTVGARADRDADCFAFAAFLEQARI
ncbi:MAG: amidase [Alphaproteobacteria bacterium]|nr:amidase [Alphaproteobacteria bacterium]